MNKVERRKELLNKRANIADRDKKNEMILTLLNDLIGKIKPESIFCYVSMGSEVDTKKFIVEQFGKNKIYVPYTVDKVMAPELLLDCKDLKTDKLGNINPQYLGEKRDFCPVTIVPMVGFNTKNIRMGYGGGYYDRHISTFRTLSIGLAFSEQLDKDLPVESHDCAMDLIITQNGVRLCE